MTTAPAHRSRSHPHTDAVTPASTAAAPQGRVARAVYSALRAADVTANGPRPHDLQIHDEPALMARLARRGITGLGEAYVDGLWDCDDLPEMFGRLITHRTFDRLPLDPVTLGYVAAEKLLNRQRRPRARRDVSGHYDQSEALFAATLDPRRVYTCGYWTWPGGARAPDLAAAQEAKLDLVCRKLKLQPGMRLLDVGCGWGSLVRYASERYGVTAHGVTLSTHQRDHAQRTCGNLPVTVEVRDYRDLPADRYDRVVSLGMFEHVGPKNHADYLRALSRCLNDDGLALLHFFVAPQAQPSLSARVPIWVERYIFPGFVTPSLGQVATMLERHGGFVLEDLHNFGQDYAPTLRAWDENFRRSWAADASLRASYGAHAPRFYRLWHYYLTYCSAVFATRHYQLFQLVLSPGGVPGGYVPER